MIGNITCNNDDSNLPKLKSLDYEIIIKEKDGTNSNYENKTNNRNSKRVQFHYDQLDPSISK